MTCAEVTVPCALNSSRRSSAVALKDRFPTYRFLPIVIPCEPGRLFFKKTQASIVQERRRKNERIQIGRAIAKMCWHPCPLTTNRGEQRRDLPPTARTCLEFRN